MISWIKKHLLPHKSNNHTPHLLRKSGTRNILIAIIFLEIFSFIIPTLVNTNMAGGLASVLPGVLNSLTNIERKSENLPELATSPVLNRAAQMKAEDMASKGYFAHTSPEGKTPWYWLELAGYKYEYAGENLAVNFTDSKDITEAWLNSPTHKANIIKRNYTEIGTGIATGTYKGQQAIFVAQVYANPLPIPVKVKPTTNTTSTKKITTNQVEKPAQQKPETIAPVAPSPTKNVLGEETIEKEQNPKIQRASNPTQKITTWQRLLTSPRNTANIAFIAIFVTTLLTTSLYLLFNRRSYNYKILNNGLLVMAIIGAVMVSNYYYSLNTMMTTSNIDYSLDNHNI